MMAAVDFLVAFTERTADGSDQRRTATLAAAHDDPIGAYREASLRWLSGSAASVRYNLEVRPLTVARARRRA